MTHTHTPQDARSPRHTRPETGRQFSARAKARELVSAVSGQREIDAALGSIPAGRKTGGVNVNTATLAELQTLHGIGPVKAAAIVAHRRKAKLLTLEDLRTVKGIGPATYAKILPFCTV